MDINFYIICDGDDLAINNKLQNINKILINKYNNVYIFKSITNKNIKTYLIVNELEQNENNNLELKNNINYYNILKNHDKNKHLCIIPSNINDINNILYFIKNIYNLYKIKVDNNEIVNFIYNNDSCIVINNNIINTILKENIHINIETYKNVEIILKTNVTDNNTGNSNTYNKYINILRRR